MERAVEEESTIASMFYDHKDLDANQVPTSTLAMIIVFVPIILAAFFFKVHDMYSKFVLDRSTSPLQSMDTSGEGKKNHALPLSRNLSSIRDLLESAATFGTLLAYCYVCEHYPPFPHGEKEHSLMFFFASFVLFMIVACSTYKECKDDSVLNRDQTEEWKGWMQFLFLTYHFAKVKEAYNLIRVLITGYVWMTGFGNFSFFYIKRDFGAVRFLQMLWRLNFLVIFLVMTMGNPYILYYICPLHTFYFVVVYLTTAPKVFSNHSQYGPRIKILIAAIAICLLFDNFDGSHMFKFIFFWVPESGAQCLRGDEVVPCPVGGYGQSWEWYFRTTLDHWSTVLGMVFALNFPVVVRWIEGLETGDVGNQRRRLVVKVSVAVTMCAVLFVWARNVLLLPKAQYNQLHAYTGCIPVVAYIFLRNCSATLRKYHLHMLASMGKITLETYLLQHHIWLTSNAKTLLVFVPEFPMVNLVLVGALYLFISKVAYRLTLRLRGILLPGNDLRSCVLNLCGIVCVVVLAFLLAAELESFGVGNHIGAVMLLCGGVAVNVILLILVIARVDDRREKLRGVFLPSVAATCSLLVLIYAVISIVKSRVVGANIDSFPPAAPAPGALKSTHPEIGSMSVPVLGSVVVVVVAVMLWTMDNFCGLGVGISRMALGKQWNRQIFSHGLAYQTLHRKLGIIGDDGL